MSPRRYNACRARTRTFSSPHALCPLLSLSLPVPLPQEPEIVLQRIHAFVTSFCKACRDNERAAFLKKKAEEMEAERLRQKEADAKAAAAAGGGAATPAAGGATPRKTPLRRVQTSGGLMMSSIQGSLRRGEFKQMKQMQQMMSEELKSRMMQRRRSTQLDDD